MHRTGSNEKLFSRIQTTNDYKGCSRRCRKAAWLRRKCEGDDPIRRERATTLHVSSLRRLEPFSIVVHPSEGGMAVKQHAEREHTAARRSTDPPRGTGSRRWL
jgi:hypothetical protein